MENQESLLKPIEHHLSPQSREYMDAVLECLIDMFPETRDHLRIVLRDDLTEDKGRALGTEDGSDSYYMSVIQSHTFNPTEKLSISCNGDIRDRGRVKMELTTEINDKIAHIISLTISRVKELSYGTVSTKYEYLRLTANPFDPTAIRTGLEEMRGELERFVAALEPLGNKGVRQNWPDSSHDQVPVATGSG